MIPSETATTTPSAKTKNRLVTLIKVGVTLLSLAYVFTQVPLSEIGEGIRQARWGWLLVAVGINFSGLVLRSVRWAILLNGIGSTCR